LPFPAAAAAGVSASEEEEGGEFAHFPSMRGRETKGLFFFFRVTTTVSQDACFKPPPPLLDEEEEEWEREGRPVDVGPCIEDEAASSSSSMSLEKE